MVHLFVLLWNEIWGYTALNSCFCKTIIITLFAYLSRISKIPFGVDFIFILRGVFNEVDDLLFISLPYMRPSRTGSVAWNCKCVTSNLKLQYFCSVVCIALSEYNPFEDPITLCSKYINITQPSCTNMNHCEHFCSSKFLHGFFSNLFHLSPCIMLRTLF